MTTFRNIGEVDFGTKNVVECLESVTVGALPYDDHEDKLIGCVAFQKTIWK